MGSLVQIQSPRPFFSSDYGRVSAGGAPAPRRPAARKTMSVVLLSNDDGVHAEGLAALGRALAELGGVCIVAPERGERACRHALTPHPPLRPGPPREPR